MTDEPQRAQTALRERLSEYAATTTTSDEAWSRIESRTRRPFAGVRWQPSVALVALAAVLFGAVVWPEFGPFRPRPQPKQSSLVAARLRARNLGLGGLPELKGTVVGLGGNVGCEERQACNDFSYLHRLDLGSMERGVVAHEGPSNAAVTDFTGIVDGRVVREAVVDPDVLLVAVNEDASTEPLPYRSPSGPARAVAAADGRVAWVADIESGIDEVRVASPTSPSGKVVWRHPSPSAVAIGPNGRLAVIVDAGAGKPKVVVLSAAGRVLRTASLPRDDVEFVGGDLEVSWSAAGLLAVSTPAMQGYGWDPPGVLVYDASDLREVARVKGWHGLAWSPDGQGLLVTRLTPQRDDWRGRTEVAVVYGDGLRERQRVGFIDGNFAGWRWTSDELPVPHIVVGRSDDAIGWAVRRRPVDGAPCFEVVIRPPERTETECVPASVGGPIVSTRLLGFGGDRAYWEGVYVVVVGPEVTEVEVDLFAGIKSVRVNPVRFGNGPVAAKAAFIEVDDKVVRVRALGRQGEVLEDSTVGG